MALWVRFERQDGRAGFGTLEADLIGVFRGELFEAPLPSGEVLPSDSVRLLPACEPGKIVALWNNFHALAARIEKAVPASPLYLIKPSCCVAGTGVPIRRPAHYAGKIVFEGELGIVIGRTCRGVPVQEAADFIFGYTCVNDVTAADLLTEDPNFAQWTRAKSFDTFGILGPAIATSLDLAAARVVTTVDGVERQNYPLSDMIFPPHELVSRISADMTLLPGDVIACGTSLGVGSIKDGATVQVTIDGIGTLSNRMQAAPARPGG
jgi:2-keto-4-pentenoate hydratase/2-oxohepta-3-ene-1,7-dioic acid hydratase in catechol pathway